MTKDIKNKTDQNLKSLSLALLSCTLLAGCGMSNRIANVGKAPDMTQITNPTTAPEYQPVSLPMPYPKKAHTSRNSLWSSDRQAFFEDQRANNVGDIVTVLVEFQDEAEMLNQTQRQRIALENFQSSRLLGLENSLDRLLPEDITDAAGVLTNPQLMDANTNSNHNGIGRTEREEEIDVRLAAIITQVLPNGNLVVNGRQEVLVNFEKRLLQIDGVIRPEDISIENTVTYDKIAEARIVYGGEGQLTDIQQPRYGQQLYDIIFPF